MTHTKGPWICHSGMVWKPDSSEDGIPIARMARDDNRTMPVERDANASLIAASPEMLEALEAIVIDLQFSEIQTHKNLVDLARAAIAKAKGSST
jgi:hypothetical protein